MNVLVTGASGFIGRGLMQTLDRRQGFSATGAVRSEDTGLGNTIAVGNIDAHTDWLPALHDVEVVVHTAARVHVMADHATDPLQAYRAVNVAGTLKLARQAAYQGVRRFIFISTIKVNGECTRCNERFTATDIPAPEDPYSVSKLEAEQGLMEIAGQTGMEIVIVRPPLVYGNGVKGNFASMIHWVRKGLPLPLGAVDNRRSMIGLDNLIDLVITCINHPSAANQIFLASDGEDLSVPEILKRLSASSGRPSRVFVLPVYLLRAGAFLLGKRAMATRLLSSLQVDMSKTQSVLGWTPPVSVDEGLRRSIVEHQDKQRVSHS